MSEPTTDTCCTICGLPIQIGDYPCVLTPRPHGRSVQTNTFIEYDDFALGKRITSLGDRWAGMKANNLAYREKMSKGDLSARLDRIHERRRS
jgi:hypothetical protein